MANIIKFNKVLLDGELHICGDFCWCYPDVKDDANYHQVTFNQEVNVPWPEEYEA